MKLPILLLALPESHLLQLHLGVVLRDDGLLMCSIIQSKDVLDQVLFELLFRHQIEVRIVALLLLNDLHEIDARQLVEDPL